MNMLGMIPYGFTVTSHIAVTFALAMLIFIGVTVIGFVKHGLGFFGFLGIQNHDLDRFHVKSVRQSSEVS